MYMFRKNSLYSNLYNRAESGPFCSLFSLTFRTKLLVKELLVSRSLLLWSTLVYTII